MTAPAHVISRSYLTSAGTIGSETVRVSGTMEIRLVVTAVAETAQTVLLSAHPAQIVAFSALADGNAVEIETDGMDAVSLADGVPYSWHSDSVTAAPFAEPITEVTIEAAAAANATVTLVFLVDTGLEIPVE